MGDRPKHGVLPGLLASRRDCLALPLLVIGAQSTVAQHHPSANKAHGLLTAESTIGDLLSHPAFSGFARRILPWDERDYDLQARLDTIGALLPYHSHVYIPSTIAALNRLIEDAEEGRQVFFEIYSEPERRAEPAKPHAGLFFLRGKPDAPFAIVSPGGGFAYVGSVHEGFPYAAAISDAGLNAFVLKYRAGKGGAVATQDLAAAIGFVFRNAATLRVDTRGYSLWGSSAGARMAASIGSHGVAAYGASDLPKPSTVVMAYTTHSDHAASEPPTFALVGHQDGIAPPAAMRQRVAALRRLGAEVDYREYPGVGHGFGLGIGTSAEGWISDAIRFWKRHQSR
ncbi:MAG: prolyl oligopeptidase family serine peptidase [Bosea sp.]|uniref:alpha/beta hydrolase n=1 Tax=Bosea sp. (in: a-proteobacteria) TaxID=1871050 RepID=UPI0023A37157|nr:prolyl oligopeptidase family serine peptidase [Bosea sp. (in: a-proteobacteria)]MCP4735710.1 prolyl oligopeptidase family serine peptidase [Bosea sp. (in: a-proteobacteria)]